MRRLAALSLMLLAATSYAADEAVTEAQKAQLEHLRAEVAGQIQLQAYDLLDELVYGWTQQPVFGVETPVVLANVSVPVGFGSGLEALIENHFAALVTQNRVRSKIVLAHCPQCTALIVHSGAKGTIVSRGVDQPDALTEAGVATGSLHALFLDFEAEGSALVLRARITTLEPSLPIIYARTLSTSTSTPALLRSGDKLKSATEARQEYLDILQGRGTIVVPVRISVRSYAQSSNSSSVSATPYIWLQAGGEIALTQARAWTADLAVGVTWLPQVESGWLVQGRINRLLTGNTSSLTSPDLYGFVGGSMITVYGPGSLIFQNKIPSVQDLLVAATNNPATAALAGVTVNPSFTFASFQVGLELRVKNRIGAGFYLETSPALNDSPNIGKYLDFGIIGFHSYGAEVTFCF